MKSYTLQWGHCQGQEQQPGVSEVNPDWSVCGQPAKHRQQHVALKKSQTHTHTTAIHQSSCNMNHLAAKLRMKM